MSSSGSLNKEHARARAVSELIQDHELNELNSGEKPAAGKRRNSNPFDSNAAKAAKFELTEELRKWAETHCPLVPIEETTNQWREFVAKQMQDKLQKPVAHWREFIRQQQAWREAEAKERAAGLVGAGTTYNTPSVRVEVKENAKPLKPAAVQPVGTGQTAAPLVRELSDDEAREFAQLLIDDKNFDQLRDLIAGNYPNIAAPTNGTWRATAEAALRQ